MSIAPLLQKVLTGLVLSASALLAQSSYAAEAAAPAADTESSDKQPAERAQKQDQPATAAAKSEVFIPTEEISEDFAVSFPVDI
jgi:uncharacterized membrane protein YkoI